MTHPDRPFSGSLRTSHRPARVAVVGGGIAGLSCARELRLRGHEPVVFEAAARLGGRCSARPTRAGWFDDGAQAIEGETRLASYLVQRPGELAALHPWTVAARPVDDDRRGRDPGDEDSDSIRLLTPMGQVGVPSMQALALAIAEPLDIRLGLAVRQAWRRGANWVLDTAAGPVDEGFQALVLALPAPLALPLAQAAPAVADALRAVRYRSRWVLLLGTERPVGLPGHRAFQGSPIERVAAMHSKPGRAAGPMQRWFIEADARWSAEHADDDAESVAERLLDIFSAHARRPVLPGFLCAHFWRHALVEAPAFAARRSACLWDGQARLGVCGDSVVASQVDRVHRSGVALAQQMSADLPADPGRAGSLFTGPAWRLAHEAETETAHG